MPIFCHGPIRSTICISSARRSQRFSSVCRIRTPPSSALREVPTPLLFLSAAKWDPESIKGMSGYATVFAEKGFTTLQTDIDVLEHVTTDSQALMDHFESKLRSRISLAGIPFPPVIFARSSAALIAQTYISSNPASGLFLISPPRSNASLPKHMLPTALKEFDYELKFPIAVMGTPEEMEVLHTESRFGKDSGVDIIEVGNVESHCAFVKMEMWLNDLGI